LKPRQVIIIIFGAALTLWLGGLLALFIFVQSLFNADRAVAVQAAPILFRVFELYQLGLAGVALISLIGWRLLVCSRPKRWMLALVLLAVALSVAEMVLVSSRMRAILAGGQTSGAEFRKLHGYSMMIYSTETILLAAAACLFPAAIRAEAEFGPRLTSSPPLRTSPETAAA
jgi:hypothetical protein